MQAAAKHEQAAKVYSRVLQQQSGQGSVFGKDGKTFLVERCCEAYAAVADWQGLQQWLQDMKVSKAAQAAACQNVMLSSAAGSLVCCKTLPWSWKQGVCTGHASSDFT